jgi:FtsZ-binding cell division protein ZapB
MDAAVPSVASDPAAAGAAAVAAEAARQSLLEEALQDLLERRQSLQREITELERRRDQLERETSRSFSGQSDAIARRLRGFQDYLVGALQDLVVAAEQIELVPQPVLLQPSPLDQPNATSAASPPPPAAAGQFSEDEPLIRRLLKRYGGQPDFYADPWKLRRTLEPTGASILEDWFLSQGGRGAQPSSGSRSRNVLIAAAAIAILGELYGDRFQTLVLAGQPERLGEWRRGLQDCLGLSREDFGPSSGIVLFERSDALIERADRLEERGELPFIVIDAAERVVEIPLLQFPLWLAFAAAADEILEEADLY